MTDFFRNIVKELNDENTNVAIDGLGSSEFSDTIDTGSYILNAVLSGSIFGGAPNNKVLALAGESATGKTFFALGMVKRFLDDNPTGACFYFDTEAAVTKDMMESRGIDPSRVIISEQETIQKFRHTAIQILENYAETPEKQRPPMMMVLDSLGQLSTTKEVEDTASGAETRDMTKAQLIKATFRVLNLKLAKVNVPLIVTNHVYDVIGSYVPMKEMGGGCLVAGTNVLTKNGYMPIENIGVDDQVFTKEGVFRPVLECHYFTNKEILEIEFENGFKVRCTPEHKFFVNGEWVEAKNISENTLVEVI